ncbi:hypothetical protein MD484_g3096, partial [Candolleomyces efflorescens]
MLFVGIHLFMFLYGLSVFLETPEAQRRGRKRYIATSLAITVLSALTASLDVANYFQVIFKMASIDQWAELLYASFSEWKFWTSAAAVGFVSFIGEMLLVYRCYIICVDYMWVALLPLSTSVSALVLFYMSIYIPASDITSRYATAATLLTVLTNVIVTTLISLHLLRARRTLISLMPGTSKSGGVSHTGIIAILVESAAPLTVFGVIRI